MPAYNLTDTSNIQPLHSISEMMRAMEENFPDAKRTARGTMRLIVATMKTANRVRKRITESDGDEEMRKKELKNLVGLIGRLEGYLTVLWTVGPDAKPPDSLIPLFRNVRAHHFTPDWLTPYSIDNRIEAIEPERNALHQYLIDFLNEAARIPKRLDDAAEQAAEAVEEAKDAIEEATVWPWVVGGVVGVGLLGTVAYAVTKK